MGQSRRPVRLNWTSLLAAAVSIGLIAASCSPETSPTATVETPTLERAPTVVVPTPAPRPTDAPQPTPVPPVPPRPLPEPTELVAATPTPADANNVPSARPPDVSALAELSSLRPVECPADVRGERVSCSLATLPRDIDAPTADLTVEIMVAAVDNDDPNDIGPVVFLQGGPGVGSVTNAKSFVGAAHDVVFVDQRGTGYSSPKLNCPEIDALWVAQHTHNEAVRPANDSELNDAYAACGERLISQGIDFDHFNTRAAATDIELLRQLLGHEQWSIWGVSYGTRLALTIMRDHPDGVRAAVLDSIVPFEVDFFATIPEHGVRAITALDQACDASSCSGEHGDFFTTLSTLVQALDRDPYVVTATRPVTGEQFPFRVDGEQLIDLVFTQLYSTRSLRSLPRQISRAEFGGLDEMVAQYVTRRDPNRLDLSVGLYYSTWCREEFPFYDPTVDDELLEGLEPQFGGAAAASLSSDGVELYCNIFAAAPAPQSENEPLTSTIPTLVFAGTFDPITPPAWSRQVADALANSVYVEMPDHGHGMATSCPVSIRVAFLEDPTEVPDTSCADAAGPPQFD